MQKSAEASASNYVLTGRELSKESMSGYKVTVNN